MNVKKVGFEETLENNVISVGKCVGCSACVVVCPFKCLEYVGGKPSLTKECEVCGICPEICPQYKWSWPKSDDFVFGRERKDTEDFGVYRRLAVAKAKSKEVLRVCQDGGVATALLLFALKEGLIDGAVVSGVDKEKPFYPMPKLAVTSEEILQCSGTRYSYSPNILALAEGIKQKIQNMAFVGTPCQIRAIRKMQMFGLKRYVAPVKFLIGLMCSETFDYERLMVNHIQETLGINLKDIEKMNIKGKMLVTTRSGVQTIPLSDIKKYARKSCGFCDDFSSELADISVGGLGLKGWTLTIIRTKTGQELFSKAENAGVLDVKNVGKEFPALNLLIKLSRKKRKIAKDC